LKDFSAKLDEIGDIFWYHVIRDTFFFFGRLKKSLRGEKMMEAIFAQLELENRFSTLACVLKRWEECLKGVGNKTCVSKKSSWKLYWLNFW